MKQELADYVVVMAFLRSSSKVLLFIHDLPKGEGPNSADSQGRTLRVTSFKALYLGRHHCFQEEKSSRVGDKIPETDTWQDHERVLEIIVRSLIFFFWLFFKLSGL